MNFWKWFFRGDSGDLSPIEKADHPFGLKSAGITLFFNKWLAIHFVVGLFLALFVNIDLSKAANSVLFPLAGVFVGLSFTWGGNAMSLMRSEEIARLADNRDGGLRQYIYKFQMAILTLLSSMIFWGLAGLELFDFSTSNPASKIVHYLIATLLYALTSCAIRECWQVVLGAQNMLLLIRVIRKELGK